MMANLSIVKILLNLEFFELMSTSLIKLNFLNQMTCFSREFNHHWKRSEQNENFQTTLVIILFNVLVQVKLAKSKMFTKENSLFELADELSMN